jgi:hypothetical protein
MDQHVVDKFKTLKLKTCTEWFRVHDFKDLSDPTSQVARKEAVVSLDQYPYDFGLGPNPREPVLTSPVSKKIGATLEENGPNFHLLNRGVTIVAKSAEYDNKTNRMRLVLADDEEEKRFFGILDGGNTNARINKYREELPEEKAREELAKRFVNAQILIPELTGSSVPSPEMMDLLNDIKEARNTSVQVKQKSIADSRRHFDVFKSVLQNQPYGAEISWHEGQRGSIDGQTIVILLMMYYPRFCEEADGREPSNAYGHKERCLDAFLAYANEEPDQLEAWIRLAPDIIRFFDHLQVSFPKHYGGRFGGTKEVQIYDERKYERGNKKYRKTAPKSQFLGNDMKYSYPIGWLYPIYAAFRVLVGSTKQGGALGWKKDPIEFWQDNGDEICKRYEPHLTAVGYDTKKVATNLICYQAMRQAVTDLYKDQIIREAGLTV